MHLVQLCFVFTVVLSSMMTIVYLKLALVNRLEASGMNAWTFSCVDVTSNSLKLSNPPSVFILFDLSNHLLINYEKKWRNEFFKWSYKIPYAYDMRIVNLDWLQIPVWPSFAQTTWDICKMWPQLLLLPVTYEMT